MANISSLFPIASRDVLKKIERNLKDTEFAEKVAEHIKEMKAHKGDIDKLLRCIFSDKLIWDYNSEGRSGKYSLLGLSLVSTHVLNEFSELSSQDFLKLSQNLDRESVETKLKMTNISTLFPISTHQELSTIEANLTDPEFAEKIAKHIEIMKIHKGVVDQVLRCMFNDKLIWDYNSEGRSGKRSLSGLNLVSTHVFNAFTAEIPRQEFIKLIRVYVLKSHNRHKNRLYNARKLDVASD